MRTELTLLEKIDLYASGKMSAADKAEFERLISNDEALKTQVETQKNLTRAVQRKALRAQINTIAAASGGGGGGSSFLIGIGSVIVVGGLVVGMVYYSNKSTHESQEVAENVVIDTTTQNQALITQDMEEMRAQYFLEEAETIFSSHIDYENEDEPVKNGDMNVTVHFRSRGEGAKVEYLKDNNPGTFRVDDNKDKPKEMNLEETDFSTKNHTHKASYPGGNIALKKFIDKNLYYPKSAQEKSIECVVRCEFHVTEDGLITEIQSECIKMADKDGVAYSDVKLLMNKRIMNSFIGNATHILRTMPAWEPARNAAGTPILSVQRMYFNYDLERGCLVYQLDEDLPNL